MARIPAFEEVVAAGVALADGEIDFMEYKRRVEQVTSRLSATDCLQLQFISQLIPLVHQQREIPMHMDERGAIVQEVAEAVNHAFDCLFGPDRYDA